MILEELRRKQQRREFLAQVFALVTRKRAIPRKVSAEYRKEVITRHITKYEQLRFNQLLYELKRDGLATGHEQGGVFLRITSRGLSWLKKYPGTSSISLPRYTQKAEKGDRPIIITYDFPNKLTSLRNWLRRSLRRLGMTALQRSVFIGKIQIPSDFLETITQFKLDKYVEICEITRAGTLRQRLP